MQLLISKCSQANGKWTDQFIRNWAWGISYSPCLYCPPHLPLLPLLPHLPTPHSSHLKSKVNALLTYIHDFTLSSTVSL